MQLMMPFQKLHQMKILVSVTAYIFTESFCSFCKLYYLTYMLQNSECRPTQLCKASLIKWQCSV